MLSAPTPRPIASAGARARRRKGAIVLSVEVDEHALAEALFESGRLPPDQCLRRPLVERTVGEILRDWTQRWTNQGESK